MTPLIIDCDPGQDDAVALLLALAAPDEFDLLGITAVAGNVPLSLTESNARRICALAGRSDVPVYAGCVRPIVNKPVTAEYVHGPSGIDGANLPEPTTPLAPGHAVDFLIDTLMSAKTPITIATLGPLTNLGLAIAKQPDITGKIEKLVLMGGAIGLGNVTPAAEFNIYVDPHAACIVFEAGLDLTMIGLDVTHQALATRERIDTIRAIGNAAAASVAGMLDYYGKRNEDTFDHGGAPLHDPCVIAYLLDPGMFDGRSMHVEIETAPTASMGRTICDVHGRTDNTPNATVLERIDASRFFSLLTERLSNLPAE